jgi:hypothetical protein
MSIETRTSRLVKKTGVEKSRWTVPLSCFGRKNPSELLTNSLNHYQFCFEFTKIFKINTIFCILDIYTKFQFYVFSE